MKNNSKQLQAKLKEHFLTLALPDYFNELSKILSIPIDSSRWHSPLHEMKRKIDLVKTRLANNYRCQWLLEVNQNNETVIQNLLTPLFDQETKQECYYFGQEYEFGAIELTWHEIVSHWRALLEFNGDDFIVTTITLDKCIQISLIDEYNIGKIYLIRIYSNDWYMKCRDILDPLHV